MNKTLLAAILLSTTALSAQAVESSYKLDPTHTFPTFEISHLGFSTFRGRFDETSGLVKYDPERKTLAVEATIKVESIDTGVDKLDDHLEKADFFDATKYPLITFKSTAAVFEGEKPVTVTGDLTMHGVTRPVTLTVDAFSCKAHPLAGVWACGADLSAKIKRSDWGIDKYVPAVGDEVLLRIEAEAHQPKK
ncbi:MAG TPA: YceI family protein [Solimonas sp.]|nr:YceI family protein [Solimonas sp.]